MNESEFITMIDSNFPYASEDDWKRIIDSGVSISSNAAFMVMHEICRVPCGVDVSMEVRFHMLAYLRKNFDHPLLPELLPIAEAMIEGVDVPCEQALKIMWQIAKFRNEYSALAIAYFSCDDQRGDVDAFYCQIKCEWEIEN